MWNPFWEITEAKRAGDMTQVVEHLNSNSSTTKKQCTHTNKNIKWRGRINEKTYVKAMYCRIHRIIYVRIIWSRNLTERHNYYKYVSFIHKLGKIGSLMFSDN
jgi:hypothetical protein